jgi:hypothetical protein
MPFTSASTDSQWVLPARLSTLAAASALARMGFDIVCVLFPFLVLVRGWGVLMNIGGENGRGVVVRNEGVMEMLVVGWVFSCLFKVEAELEPTDEKAEVSLARTISV